MSNWTTKNIPDQKGRVVIVTGGNSGIGFETAKALAEKNAHVILAVRSEEKGQQAVQEIHASYPSAQVEVRLLDLANLSSVQQFASSFNQDFNRLDLLINNAGIMVPPYHLTQDGFESQFGTNHLGHFALTAQLIDLIVKTDRSRIVNVSSSAHRSGKLNFEDLAWEKRRYASWRAYGDSKIANLYFTYELVERLKKAGHNTLVTAAHPGLTRSNLFKGFWAKLFLIFAQSTHMGALPTLMAATDRAAQSGDYFGPAGIGERAGYPRKVKSNKLSHDQVIGKKLWEVSEVLTSVKFTI